MIEEMSGSAQFILTTFRNELIQHADKFFGVIFNARKVSSIRSITQEQALEFVESNEKGREDGGK